MDVNDSVTRRKFVGGVATAAGLLGLSPKEFALFAQGTPNPALLPRRTPMTEDEYDGLAKLANNENPYGPPDSVLQAMTHAFKFANRYGYPDGGIVEEIAKHHGVKNENVMIAAGSGEILDVVGLTFLDSNDKKVVGVDPSYGSVYQVATSIKAEAFKIPLLPDYRQDIPAMIKAVHTHYRDVGFVYMCNPNNPTGRIVTKKEIRQLLDGIPEDVPVLIDEAYHHFVDNKEYETSIPYVLEGRPVIIARTFSKIAALAGMRLGYAVAPRELLAKMRPHTTGTISAVVKYGGVAALKDVQSQAKVKAVTVGLRNKATKDLNSLGYETIPSEANFFMVNIKRQVTPVIQEFQKRGVLVGRPFPPMLEHLRVSVGTEQEMARFATAFREIFTGANAVGGGKSGSSGSF